MRAYHGTTDAIGDAIALLPPCETGAISEKGRKRNLDRVFATKDIGLARIYAGRAARSIGGKPVVLEVILPDDHECLSDARGATVYHAEGAWIVSKV